MLLRCLQPDQLIQYNDDGLSTATSREQDKVERSIKRCYDYVKSVTEIDPDVPKLLRELHSTYLEKGLNSLPQSYQCLDASRPWLTYWIVNSLAVLGDFTTLSISSSKITSFINKCSNSSGGYGGGPSQISHLATTYAAINALVSLCNEEALESIDRKSLLEFLCDMKQTDGSFSMHKDGEIDVRGVYCAVSVAVLCGIESKKLFENTADWVLSCQTYEGGFGGSPGNEAHGGYSFCAISALLLLGEIKRCDIKSVLKWTSNKQQHFEGGFAGRTNKLVDGCYSFWQGAIFPILHQELLLQKPENTPSDVWLFNQTALQEYLLCCCQDSMGGMIDKPDRRRDYYHTCYDLSGLAVAQHTLTSQVIIGPTSNDLMPVHPVFNINIEGVRLAKEYFSQRKILS